MTRQQKIQHQNTPCGGSKRIWPWSDQIEYRRLPSPSASSENLPASPRSGSPLDAALTLDEDRQEHDVPKLEVSLAQDGPKSQRQAREGKSPRWQKRDLCTPQEQGLLHPHTAAIVAARANRARGMEVARERRASLDPFECPGPHHRRRRNAMSGPSTPGERTDRWLRYDRYKVAPKGLFPAAVSSHFGRLKALLHGRPARMAPVIKPARTPSPPVSPVPPVPKERESASRWDSGRFADYVLIRMQGKRSGEEGGKKG